MLHVLGLTFLVCAKTIASHLVSTTTQHPVLKPSAGTELDTSSTSLRQLFQSSWSSVFLERPSCHVRYSHSDGNCLRIEEVQLIEGSLTIGEVNLSRALVEDQSQ